MTFDADLVACAALVERADPIRFRTAMAAPVAERAKLFPLYAFNAEVARAPRVTQESMIAEMRLQWWRDVCEEIAEGKPVRRHEVATPLARVLSAEGARLLDELTAARRWDIYRDAFEDAAHFERYIDQTSGHLMWVAARSLGAPQEAETTVRLAAHAAGIAAWLRAAPVLRAEGRKPLAEPAAETVQSLAHTASDALRRARRNRSVLPASAAPALWPAMAADHTLRQARRDPERLLAQPQEARLSPWRLALRAATGGW